MHRDSPAQIHRHYDLPSLMHGNRIPPHRFIGMRSPCSGCTRTGCLGNVHGRCCGFPGMGCVCTCVPKHACDKHGYVTMRATPLLHQGSGKGTRRASRVSHRGAREQLARAGHPACLSRLTRVRWAGIPRTCPAVSRTMIAVPDRIRAWFESIPPHIGVRPL